MINGKRGSELERHEGEGYVRLWCGEKGRNVAIILQSQKLQNQN